MTPVDRLDGLGALPAGLDGSVVTVGMFDGVHRGHLALLDRVAAEAAARRIPAAAVTFDRHPLAILRPGSEPPLLTSLDRKVELLGQAGMQVVLVLEFTEELSHLGAEDFATQVLFDGLAARAVVVGENFRFGHKAAGDPALLADLGRPRGIEVVAVPLQAAGDEVVSSTRVRTELAAGDVEAAAASLGRAYAVEGEVVVGDRRGGPLLGVPTANLAVPAGIAIPADGVYAGHLTDQDADRLAARPAAISVGTNPQFGTDRRVEAHVLDFDGDLYGHRVAVDFTHHLRDQATFAGVEELISQIKADVVKARRLLDPPAVVQHTVARGELPALVVIHDDEDYWLAGDGVNDPNAPGASGIYHMSHLIAHDSTMAATLTLPRGYAARRDSSTDQWHVEPWHYR